MEFREIRRYASLGGIVLAAVSTVYMLLDFNFKLLNPENAVWMNILKIILNLTKIIACIYLMRYFMVRFRNDHESATQQDVRKVGTLTAFLSALIFATMTMAYLRFNSDLVAETFDAFIQTNGKMMDSNSFAAIGKAEENFPTIMFFAQLIYCFLYGWILTAILAPRVVSSNPFADDEKNEKQ